jgi:plasmid rolling circle replication initiator protein Rep
MVAIKHFKFDNFQRSSSFNFRDFQKAKFTKQMKGRDDVARDGCFNTLAQNGTSFPEAVPVIVQGSGSDLKNTKSLKGRAKRKLITQATVLGLIDIAKELQFKELSQSYWNTFHCQNSVLTVDNRLYSLYCKNRYCTLCSANRKADIINRYLPIIEKWKCPHFLTLTVKSVPYSSLRKVMIQMVQVFRKIIGKYRKQFLRGTGPRLIGIRSLESNYNPKTNEYNPHFHIIVPDKETGVIIMEEWVKRAKPGKAAKWCQKLTRVKSNIKALIETVKYGSKIISEPDLKRTKLKAEPRIYVLALHHIFQAMKGLRIFERFGFNLPKNVPKTPCMKVVSNGVRWEYDINRFDWFDEEGNSLTGYMPPGGLVDILENLNYGNGETQRNLTI